MLKALFDQFVEKSPIPVMARGMMERILNPEQIDDWFDSTAESQYTKDLLFSSVLGVMCQVVLGTRESVHAAWQNSRKEIGVSVAAVYDKLNGVEPETSAGLLRYASGEAAKVVEKIGGAAPSPLPGLRLKLLDGNCLEKSHHRIKELRTVAAGPLPGKSLVVYDPSLRMPIDVFPCEDGHAQERSLLEFVLPTVEAGDAWVADRNFCTVGFTCGIAQRGAFFIFRQHGKYPCKPLGKEKYVGKSSAGRVYEQPVAVTDENGGQREFRRIRIRLDKPTRDGDVDLFIVSNLSKSKANAKKIAELYRGRWKIETAFQHLKDWFKSEINSLGYPRAALFGFCVALVAYTVIAVIRAALCAVHGFETIENGLSGYYVADEISGIWRGMMIAVPDKEWVVFRGLTLPQLLKLLKKLAANTDLPAFRKHPRGPKKPPPKRESYKNKPHVSTKKIISERKGK
jgi:hypothetical protein